MSSTLDGLRFWRLLLITLVLVLGAVIAARWAVQRAEYQALHEAAVHSDSQLRLYATSLHTLIERYRVMPSVLALDPELREALSAPLTPEIQHRLNLKLERINEATRSSTLEVMNAEGLAVAASNWQLPTSYVGHNYHFRPYFQQAKVTGSGRFYGVGVVSGIPGYFLSRAIQDEQGQFLGVMVVKLEFPELEQSWSQRPDIILVSDERGVVFIANQPGWRYRMLRPLTEQDRQELQAERQYYNQSLVPLAYQDQQILGPGQRWVRIRGPERVGYYLWNTLPLPAEGWNIHLLRPSNGLDSSARMAGVAAAGAWLALGFAALLLVQRRRLAQERQRRRQELEQLVEERTAALRTAQDGLIQAAKLAALGQMSAAMAHELNQPLTAQRMQLASLRLLLDQNRLEDARRILGKLEDLLSRMAALTGHLKTYARQSPRGLREAVDLAAALEHALELLEPRLRGQPVEIRQYLDHPIRVWGDPIRLEQVLVNLIRNGLDAVVGCTSQWLEIRSERQGDRWCLSVTDSGTGIAPEHLAQVFDPFFTTKPVGEGLGLGLAVSCAIAHELGGELTAENTEHGACFRLILPAVV